jgi:hypothetical protein
MEDVVRRGFFVNFTREGPPLPAFAQKLRRDKPGPPPLFKGPKERGREKIIVGRHTQGVALGYHLSPFQGFSDQENYFYFPDSWAFASLQPRLQHFGPPALAILQEV